MKSKMCTVFVVGAVLLMLPVRLLLSQSSASTGAPTVYRTVSSSVFLIEVRDAAGQVSGFGSAFLIEGGRLITNAHVVNGGQPFLRTGAVALPLLVERLDPQNDLAVLTSDAKLDATPLRFDSAEPPIGTTVFAIGNPRGLERSISEGLIAGVRERDGRRLLQVTAPISPGSSGGPVVNRDGEVVGVTVGYLDGGQSLNFAIPSAVVRALIAGSESASPFVMALAQAKQLASQESPDFRDSLAWKKYRNELRAALERAGSNAPSSEDLLDVTALAFAEYQFDLSERFAEQLIRRRSPRSDSARVLLAATWELQLIFADDTIGVPELRYKLAVADTLIVKRPKRAATHNLRAQILSRLGRGREALDAARQSVVIGADHSAIGAYWTNYHSVAAKHGTAADDDAVFARQVNAGHADEYDWAAHAEHLSGREAWGKAGEAFDQAFSVSGGKSGRYACHGGRAYWTAMMLDPALEALRRCVRVYSLAGRVDTANVVYAHRAIAAILNERGVYGQAESHARQAIALDPTSAWAAFELSHALRELQRPSEAVIAAEAAIRLSDGGLSVMHFQAGTAYFELKDWARCTRAFQQAAELDSTSSQAAYNAGLCLANQGYRRDAALAMETALSRDPTRRDRADIEAMIRSWRY